MPATQLRHTVGGTLPKDLAPSQLPSSTDGNSRSESHISRPFASPSTNAEIVPAIAVAKNTSIMDARASFGGIGWRR